MLSKFLACIIACTLYANVLAYSLMQAVQENNLKKVKQLIKNAADVTESLETAVEYGYSQIVAEILKNAGTQLTNHDLRLALADVKRVKNLGDQHGWKPMPGVAMPKKENVEKIIALLIEELQQRGENISR